MSRSAWLAASLGALVWLAALPASAAISADIPPECGSLSEFEQELEQRLGNATAAQATRVTLTPEVSGYRLVVEAANQRRELHDASCQELLRAAVVIALALLDPKREEQAMSTAASARPASSAPASSAPSAPPAPSDSHHSRPKVALGAGVGAHLGTLPKVALMLEFDAQLKWTPFGVALGFRYLLPTSSIDETGRGARIGAAGAYLAGLFEPWQRVQMRLGVATYRLSASGIGGVDPRDGSAWELAPTLGVNFTPFERPPFWTSVGLEGQLNLIRPSFEIRNYNEVFHVPLVSGSALARAGVVF
ncbi:MAG TPA: hypothetical protein VJV79_06990 [Polyangiaceae bacterium]|nr:hypothetical protein [Polyangiaceae bacterium]